MGERVFEKLSAPQDLHESPLLVFAGDALAAGGLRGLGRVVENGRPRPRRQAEFLQLCRELSKDGFIDGCLLTPADAETLAVEQRLFDNIPVTPLVRLNAETSIWSPRHGQYRFQAAQPFQTVSVKAQAPEAAYCTTISGALECHVRMGLYSITLNNDVDADRRTLLAYLEFAREVGDHPQFDHFLEVFLPNVNLPGLDTEKRGQYVADSIVRTMSYLKKHQRPRFIKTEFTSAATWRELCEFDPTLIIGALGGPRVSARKTLELAYNVVTNGGRAALFGRTIFEDDNPRAMCQALRAVLDRSLSVDAAFTAYQRGGERERGRGERVRDKIVSHRELDVYKQAFGLAMRIFEISKGFSKEETYSLTDQMRRSSRSVCANLAEAWRKRRYEAAFIAKLSDAETEAAENQTWLEFAVRCGYIQTEIGRELYRSYDSIIALIVSMINNPEKWLLPPIHKK